MNNGVGEWPDELFSLTQHFAVSAITWSNTARLPAGVKYGPYKNPFSSLYNSWHPYVVVIASTQCRHVILFFK